MEEYEWIRSRRRTLTLEITRDAGWSCALPCDIPGPGGCVCGRSQKLDRPASGRGPAADSTAPPPPAAADIAALKERARQVLPPLVAAWSQKTGLCPTGVKITSARKRYGSCSGTNSLCFSCFLMNSPPQAIEAVVVHELCHIREKNHGPRFYALLEHYLPDYRARRKLLK